MYEKVNVLKNKIVVIIPYILVALTTLFAFYSLNSFWNWNIDVPISFAGDAITDGGTLTLAQKAIKGEGILSTQGFWTVDDSNMAWGIIDGSTHYLLMRILAVFLHNPGRLANVYFMLTFGLSGCMMFYVLKRLKIDVPVAYAISVLFAFVPGHWLRGINHLAIGSCFPLPLMVLGCVYIIMNDGEFLPEKDIVHGKITINRYVIEGILGSLLVGFSSIYFCVFSMICHFFSGMISLLNRNKKAKYAVFFLLADFFAIFCTVFIPDFFNNTAISSLEVSRQSFHIDIFGMKIPQLILPIQDHRIPFLANFRMNYGLAYGENENAWSSLGLFFSLGLIISLVLILKDEVKNKKIHSLKQIGKLNLLIIIVSVIGGICELIGLFFNYLRCYNRMSFIIAVLSAIVMAVLINMFFDRKKIFWKWIISIIIVVVFLFEETPAGAMIDIENAGFYEETWNSEKKFFASLEENNISNVLIYPSKYSDLYSSVFEVGHEVMKPYIYTDNIKFTTGYAEGSATDEWIKALEEFDDLEKIKICVGMGFDGILLYKHGFATEEDFQKVYNGFLDILGDENLMISEDEQWYYFSISEEKEKIEANGFNMEEIYNECKKITVVPEEIELSQEYAFGTDEFEPYIVEGMGNGEIDHRWSVNNKSIISFSIDKEAFGDIDIQLQYCALQGEHQELVIYVNDQFLKEVNLTEYSGIVAFTIPRDMLQQGEAIIEISYSDPSSPASEGIGSDIRELAVAWENILIEDTGNHVESYYRYSKQFMDYLGR